MEKFLIGPSTGWLYAKEMYSLRQQEAILKKAQANCFEIVVGECNGNSKRMLSLKQGEQFDRDFAYRSVHLFDVSDQQLDNQIRVAQEAITLCNASIAVSHIMKVNGEYPLNPCERMIAAGVPLAMENMDSRKDSGFLLADLVQIGRSLSCPFVLDVQHAYEHDHSMAYAQDLFQHLQEPLVHLHVSGQTPDNIHALVYKASNAKEIVEFVGYVLSRKVVPLILEGEYTNAGELSREIQFLKKELDSSESVGWFLRQRQGN